MVRTCVFWTKLGNQASLEHFIFKMAQSHHK